MQQKNCIYEIKGNKSEIGYYPFKKEFLVGLKDKYPANVLPEAPEELPVVREELPIAPEELLLPPDKHLLATEEPLLLPDKHLLPPDKHLRANDKKTLSKAVGLILYYSVNTIKCLLCKHSIQLIRVIKNKSDIINLKFTSYFMQLNSK